MQKLHSGTGQTVGLAKRRKIRQIQTKFQTTLLLHLYVVKNIRTIYKKKLSHLHTICREDARGEEGGKRGADLLPGHSRHSREAHPVRQPGCKKIA